MQRGHYESGYSETNPLHIALLSPAWPVGERANGIATYVHHIRAALISQGHRVSVVTNVVSPTNTNSGVHQINSTARYRLQSKLLGPWRERSSYVFRWGCMIGQTLNELHRKDPIDVVEMEESFGWCADVQRVVPMPVIVKLHGPAFLCLPEREAREAGAIAKIEQEGKALRRMAALISPSESTLRDTKLRYSLSPIVQRVIRNPLPAPHDVSMRDRRQYKEQNILFVGRFDKLKGGDIVLRAFGRLLKKNCKLGLLFVGPDLGIESANGARLNFEQYAAKVLTDEQRRRVRFFGTLTPEEIRALRREAQVTVIASRWENQPNTALEAMAQGCPLVAFDVGGMREVIVDGLTGLLARHDDLNDLCNKIQQLLDNPAWAGELGAASRRLLLDRHSASSLAKETVAVYREAIEMAKGLRR